MRLHITEQHSSIGNKANHSLDYVSKTAAGRSGENNFPPFLVVLHLVCCVMFRWGLPPSLFQETWRNQRESSRELVYVQGPRKQDLWGDFQGAMFVESGKEETKEWSRLPCRPKEHSWLVDKKSFLKGQEQSILMCSRLIKHGRRPAWMKKELLTELRHKN